MGDSTSVFESVASATVLPPLISYVEEKRRLILDHRVHERPVQNAPACARKGHCAPPLKLGDRARNRLQREPEIIADIVTRHRQLDEAGPATTRIHLHDKGGDPLERRAAAEQVRMRFTYERAVCNMVDRTSTEIAPWTLVEANDKSFARVKVLKTLCERIGKAL